GPILGGVLAEYFSWHLIFWLYIPIVIFGLVMSFILVKPREVKKSPFPFMATLLMVVGVVAFVTGLMEGNSWGWSTSWILVFVVVGPIFVVMFVIASLAAHSPLTDFTLMKSSLFAGAVITRFIAYLLVTVAVLWVVFFEKELGQTPAEIGLLMVIAALPVIALAPIGGIIADRYWYRLPLMLGFVLLVCGFCWIIFTAKTELLWCYLPGLCSFGIALPFIMAPTLALGLSSVPAEQLGSAAGIMMSARQLASTIGIAIMTALYYSQQPISGFVAISLFSLILSALGLFIVMLLVRQKDSLPH
ncbi:MAG: MFS transporter, partial [Chlamydiales bacterium]